MMKGIVYCGFACAIALLAGCASTSQPTAQELASDSAKADKIRAEAAAEQQKRNQAEMEAQISEVPGWSLQVPAPDDTGVYAVGIGKSSDMRVAMRKSMLDGEFELVKNINQEISGSERSYTQDTNNSVNSEQYTALIDKLVRQVPMSGVEVVKRDIKVIGGKFNAFVMLKLPYDEFNKVLQQQHNGAQETAEAARIQKAFDDLQKRIDKRRQQQIEDEDRQKNSEMPTTGAAPATKPAGHADAAKS